MSDEELNVQKVDEDNKQTEEIKDSKDQLHHEYEQKEEIISESKPPDLQEEEHQTYEPFEGLIDISDRRISENKNTQLKLNYVFDEVRRVLCDIDGDIQDKKKEINKEISKFNIPLSMKTKKLMTINIPPISKKQRNQAVKPLKDKSIPNDINVNIKKNSKKHMDIIENVISSSIESSLKKCFDQNLIPSFQKSCNYISSNTHKQLFSNMNEYNHMILNLCRQKSEQFKEVKASKQQRHDLKISQMPTTFRYEDKKLDEILKKKDYNEAFVHTLLKRNVPSLLDLCLRMNKSHLFSQSNSVLSQEVLLGIIQQFCSQLDGETFVKLEWINSSLEVLLTQNIKYNIDKYLDEMQSQLKSYFRRLDYNSHLRKEISYAIVNLQELEMNQY